MKGPIVLSPLARRDIETVLDQTLDRFGQEQHDRYARLITKALNEICAAPNGFRATRRPDIGSDILLFHIGRRGEKARHLFVYRLEAGGVIRIARLLHDAMDIRRHVAEGLEPVGGGD